MKTSELMDKQIMELSRSQSYDFSDFAHPHDHEDDHEEEDHNYGVFPSFDFHPITSCASMDRIDFAKAGGKKVGTLCDAALVAAIDRKLKEHCDNLLHAVEGISARLSQLESRTRQLENAVDDLKESVEFNHGRTDGKLRELEHILKRVQGGIQEMRDKQEIAEAELELAQCHVSKGDLKFGNQNGTVQTDLSQKTLSSVFQQSSSVQQQSYQPLSIPVACPQQLPALSPNVHPNLPPQNPPPTAAATAPKLPPQLPQNVIPSIPQPESYYSPPVLTPETTHQRYHIPSTQQSQPPPPVPQQPYQPAPQLPPMSQLPQLSQPHPPLSTVNPQDHRPLNHQPEEIPYILQNIIPSIPQPESYYSSPVLTLETTHQRYHIPPTQQSQPPPPVLQQPYQPAPQLPPISQLPQLPQPHPPLSTVNPQDHRPLNHEPEEILYMPSQSYSPGIHQSSQPPGRAPQQFYVGSATQIYDQPSSRPHSEFSTGHSSFNDLHGYSGSSRYSSSTMKPSQFSPPPLVPGGGSSYSQLPTARILPDALPTASSVDAGSGSGGTGNRVPIDDVVDNVVVMGFRRDLVRATVRKLTENGQSVDLNVVLDKLMNNGDGQSFGQ